MEIRTTRFGSIDVETKDIIHFPAGMLGLGDCQDWVLLADSQHDAFGWLQCTTRPEIAMAVISPRRFVPDYEVRIAGSELNPLALDSLADAHVLVILCKNDES